MSKDDEYFRIAVSSMVNRSQKGEQIWNERVIERTFKKRRLGKLLEELVVDSKPSSIQTPLGVFPTLAIPFRAAEVNRVLVRITKAFLFLTHPEVDSASLDYEVTMITQFKFDSFAETFHGKLPYFELGDGVFRMWRALTESELGHGIWIYLFYDSAGFGVVHKPKD